MIFRKLQLLLFLPRLGLSEQLTLRPETDTSRPKPEATTGRGDTRL